MLSIISAIENDFDRNFVEDIYEKYSKKMYLLAMDILKNHHDSEDCVHDIIQKIIDNLEKFKNTNDELHLKRLIVITSKNVIINKYNVNKRRYENVETLTKYESDKDEYLDVDIADISYSVDDLIISEENCSYLKKLIDKLDNKYREVILLKAMSWSTEDIGELLEISPDLVRQRLKRSRSKILEMGGEELYELCGNKR